MYGLHGNLALHAQLTYKQNEKQYYKHTLQFCCLLVVLQIRKAR